MKRQRPGWAGALESLRSRLLLGLFDLFLVGNMLVPAGTGIDGSGGAVEGIPRADAFALIGATVGARKAVMARSAVSRTRVGRTFVVAVGKCCRHYEEACEDGTDQKLAMKWLATRGVAHGRFLGSGKAILAIGPASIHLSEYQDRRTLPTSNATSPEQDMNFNGNFIAITKF